MRIETSHDKPPIPTTACDWSAVDRDTYDGAPDAGRANTIGYGATEIAAINDLVEKLIDNALASVGAL